MKKLIVLSILLLIVSCGTTKNKEDYENENEIPAHLLAKATEQAIDQIMNNPDLTEEMKKDIIEHINQNGLKNNDTIKSVKDYTAGVDVSGALHIMASDGLLVSPNPTAGDVMVEINRNHPEIDNGGKTLPLDLYYESNKINSLSLSIEGKNKAIISSNYLQKNGTYTIVCPIHKKLTTSFVVFRK